MRRLKHDETDIQPVILRLGLVAGGAVLVTLDKTPGSGRQVAVILFVVDAGGRTAVVQHPRGPQHVGEGAAALLLQLVVGVVAKKTHRAGLRKGLERVRRRGGR